MKKSMAVTVTADENSTKKLKSPKSNIDGSWAWVILFASVFNAVIATGQIASVNIYYVIFLEAFQQSSSFTAWIPAAQNTALCLNGPVSSYLLAKLGPRLIIVLGSLLMCVCFIFVHFSNSLPYLILNFALIGAAQNLIDTGGLSALSIYFRKKASLATGVMIAGAGIGTMVIGIQLDWMVDMFGWRGAMFIQAGLALQVCISACLIFKLPSPPVLEHNGLTTDDLSKANNNTNNQHVSTPSTASSDISIRTLIRQPLFWLTVMSLMAIQTNFATMGTILKDFTINIGLQDSFKTLLLVMGLSNTVSRIVAGPICNLIAAPILFSVVSILFAGVNVLLIYCDVEWALLAVGSGFGLCQGTILVTWVVKIAWIYGQKEMPIVRGYVMFFGIITGLTIPPVIGYSYDTTGNYNIALILASISTLMGAFCGFLIYFIHRKNIKASQTPTVNNDCIQTVSLELDNVMSVKM